MLLLTFFIHFLGLVQGIKPEQSLDYLRLFKEFKVLLRHFGGSCEIFVSNFGFNGMGSKTESESPYRW